MKTVKTLLIALLILAVSPIATAQTAEEIVANYFENTGGKDAWAAIKSMQAKGKANMGGQLYPFVQTVMLDGRMAVQVDLQGQMFTPQAFDGKQQWSTNFQSMTAQAADEETSTNYARNEAKDFPDPFFDYKSKGYSIELMGEEVVEGTETYKIKLTKNPILVDGNEESLFVIYYFDKENFVPILQEATMTSGPQKGMKVETLYSDYQEAGDIFFPYTIGIKFGGQLGQTINMENIEINNEIDETIFVMPESSDAGSKN